MDFYDANEQDLTISEMALVMIFRLMTQLEMQRRCHERELRDLRNAKGIEDMIGDN
jgi:hypothetical protein